MNDEHKGNGQATMTDAPKDFFNVVAMSQDFRELSDAFEADLARRAQREPVDDSEGLNQRDVMNTIQMWQARALMACAQQMVQINMSLKKLIIQRERPQLPRPLPKKKSGPKDSLTMD